VTAPPGIANAAGNPSDNFDNSNQTITFGSPPSIARSAQEQAPGGGVPPRDSQIGSKPALHAVGRVDTFPALRILVVAAARVLRRPGNRLLIASLHFKRTSLVSRLLLRKELWNRRPRSLACAILPACLLLAAAAGCQSSASSYNVSGVQQYQRGQYQMALYEFQQALTADPNNADAYYNVAATYHQMHRLNPNKQTVAKAEQLYNLCLDKDPNHTDCYRGLAKLLQDDGRGDKAFTLLERWKLRSHNLAAPRIELARLSEETGDIEGAKRHLTEAISLDPHNATAFAALGRLRERTDVSQALANYMRAYQIDPMRPGLAERIAALQRTVGGGVTAPTPTHTVVLPGPAVR